MKKFLAYLLIIVVAISLSVAVFYVYAHSETMKVNATLYKEVGDVFDIEIERENPRDYTDIEITSTDENVVSYENGKFIAKSGGSARINFTTTNVNFRNLHCDVLVGNGSSMAPYYISTPEQLALIGEKVLLRDGTYGVKYGLGDCYKLTNDIDVSSINNGYWKPIGAFSGTFDGSGYTISNINIDKTGFIANNEGSDIDANAVFTNVGLFNQITSTGNVFNLKLDKYNAIGSYTSFGTVAGINNGNIERVEVVEAFLNINGLYLGGIAGKNESVEGYSPSYIRKIAKIDRCSINMTAGRKLVVVDDVLTTVVDGIVGIFGGITGVNNGAVVIYCYTKGSVYLGESGIVYGGIVGQNNYTAFNDSSSEYSELVVGGKIKDSYTSLYLYVSQVINLGIESIGAVIGENNDYKANIDSEIQNTIFGTYYDRSRLYISEVGVDKTDLAGVGETTITDENNIIIIEDRKEEKYYILGYNSARMKEKENYYSHIRNERIYDTFNNLINETPVSVAWRFDEIWEMNEFVNDGYPYLNYFEIDIVNEFLTEKIVVLESKSLVVSQGIAGVEENSVNLVKIKVYNKDNILVDESSSALEISTFINYRISKSNNIIYIYDLNNDLVYYITYDIIDSAYDFAEWSVNGKTNWSVDVLDANKELVIWVDKIPDSYTVTFDYNGATGGNLRSNLQVIYGGTYNSLPVPTKSNYVFAGWYLESGFLTQVTRQSVVNVRSNHKLYAKWVNDSGEINPPVAVAASVITLNANGGSVSSASKVVTYNSFYTLPIPTYAGNTFLGWFTAKDSGVQLTSTNGESLSKYNYNGDITAYAHWKSNIVSQATYLVNLNANGGLIGGLSTKSIIVAYGSSYNLGIPARSGYTFSGWYTSSNVNIASNGTWAYNYGLNLTAIWIKNIESSNSYTVYLNAEGGLINGLTNHMVTVTYGSLYNLGTPVRSGYNFAGWYTSANVKIATSGTWNCYYGLDLSARWIAIDSPATYIVNLNANGGLINGLAKHTVTVTYGSSYNLGTPARSGYTFNGWYTSSNVKIATSGTWAYNYGLSLTASYVLNDVNEVKSITIPLNMSLLAKWKNPQNASVVVTDKNSTDNNKLISYDKSLKTLNPGSSVTYSITISVPLAAYNSISGSYAKQMTYLIDNFNVKVNQMWVNPANYNGPINLYYADGTQVSTAYRTSSISGSNIVYSWLLSNSWWNTGITF